MDDDLLDRRNMRRRALLARAAPLSVFNGWESGGARYGADWPVATMAGLLCGTFGFVLFSARLLNSFDGPLGLSTRLAPAQHLKAAFLLAVSVVLTLMCWLLLQSTTVGKRHEKAHFVQHMRRWSGAERVLDVGCGSGAFLCEVAKHLRASAGGRAVGIDVWPDSPWECARRRRNALDPASPRADAAGAVGGLDGAHESDESSGVYRAMTNAFAEGVSDRVQLQRTDARVALPRMASQSFDAVVCAYTLHALTPAERVDALTHMVRLLRPGGTLALIDVYHERMLTALGAAGVDLTAVTTWRPVAQWFLSACFNAGCIVYTHLPPPTRLQRIISGSTPIAPPAAAPTAPPPAAV